MKHLTLAKAGDHPGTRKQARTVHREKAGYQQLRLGLPDAERANDRGHRHIDYAGGEQRGEEGRQSGCRSELGFQRAEGPRDGLSGCR